jgi:putative Holliday junction resolvase
MTDVLTFPILGLDVSERRIGVAVADPPPAHPRPLFTHARTTRAEDLREVVACVKRYACAGVVVGLPLNMDGTPGPRAVWMRRFARELQQQLDVPVLLQDERLSTVEAQEILRDQGLDWAERAVQVDAVAAALILEWYLHEHADG